MIALWKIRIWIESKLVSMHRKIENRRTSPPVWDERSKDE